MVKQGLTKTKSGSHQKGDGLDFFPPEGMSIQNAIASVKQMYPGAKAAASNKGTIHITFPGWGKAPDVSGSRERYGD